MQKSAESEIKRLPLMEREHELILEVAGEGTYKLNREGRGTLVNVVAMNLLSPSVEDFAAQVLSELHHHTRADASTPLMTAG